MTACHAACRNPFPSPAPALSLPSHSRRFFHVHHRPTPETQTPLVAVQLADAAGGDVGIVLWIRLDWVQDEAGAGEPGQGGGG